MTTCAFLGNAADGSAMRFKVASAIRQVIRSDDSVIFLVGDKDPFDVICAEEVQLMRKRCRAKSVALYLVADAPDSDRDRAVQSLFYDKIVNPCTLPGAENGGASALRYRMEQADVMITCIEGDPGRTAWLNEYEGERRAKRVVHLEDIRFQPRSASLRLENPESASAGGKRHCTIACIRKYWLDQSPAHELLLDQTLEFLIRRRGVTAFWVEQLGVDSPAVRAVRRLRAVCRDIELTLILHDEVSLCKYESVYQGIYDQIFCSGVRSKVLRSKVLGTYKWMIDRSEFLLCSSEADTPLDTSLLQYAGKCSHIQTVDMAGAEVTGQTMGATWQTERLQPVLYDAK